MAFLVLLKSLKPVESRGVLLREVFEYGYPEIAEIVGKSEANCRQLFARARQRIEAGTPRFEASSEERDELARRFLAACGKVTWTSCSSCWLLTPWRSGTAVGRRTPRRCRSTARSASPRSSSACSSKAVGSALGWSSLG